MASTLFKFRTMNTIKDRTLSADSRGVVNEMVLASDVDLIEGGVAWVRQGYRNILAGAHSLWSNGSVCLFVRSSVLYRMHDDMGGADALYTLKADDPMDYEVVNDMVVFSNGTDIGWLSPDGAESFSDPVTGLTMTLSVGSTIQIPNSLEPTPAGHFITLLNGTLLIASDNVLVRTRPYNIEAVHRVAGYTPFGSHITMLRAVDNGAWLSTLTETYFIPEEGPVIHKGPYPAIERTAYVSKGEFYGSVRGPLGETIPTMTGKVVWWMSPHGVCVGGNNGEMHAVSEQKVTVSKGDRGAGLFRDLNGQRHYLAVIDGIA